jgi:hypothetical protein
MIFNLAIFNEDSILPTSLFNKREKMMHGKS